MDPVTFAFPGFRKIINFFKRTMDPKTITFPGFRNLCQDKFSGNDYVIVFPTNFSDKKFSRSIYSPEMTDGRASSEDIDQALRLFEVSVSPHISAWEMVQSFFWRILLPFVMMCIFEGSWNFRRSEAIWICFSFYCIVSIIFWFVNKNAQIKRAKANSQGVLDFVQPGFLQRGLRWRIPEEFNGRIELIKEYRENEIVTPPAVVKVNSQYEPPQNIA